MSNMDNLDKNLNPKIFDLTVEQIPLRAGFGEGLYRLGHDYPSVVALCADLTESTKVDKFAQVFPERFVEVGVAEQNLAAVASGMAAMGKIPFITSYAIFSPGRNWEQIRTTICYNNQPVKIIGSHAGVSVGPDGASHQALEDIALTRVLPRMTVIVPCDAIEARKATLDSVKINGPVYIRLAREKSPIITTEASPFSVGQANILWDSEKPEVAIIACGPLVHNALLVAKNLSKEGVEVMVINNHTIKPIDQKTIIAAAKKAGAVVTVEEHQVAGGMGSAVAEVLAQHHPVPIEFVGVHDRFGQSGIPQQLIEEYGMGVHSIMEAVLSAIERKK